MAKAPSISIKNRKTGKAVGSVSYTSPADGAKVALRRVGPNMKALDKIGKTAKRSLEMAQNKKKATR